MGAGDVWEAGSELCRQLSSGNLNQV